MGYRYSSIDKSNLGWFINNVNRNTLHELILETGSIRGLHQFSLKFLYPITAISGENGSGKSTILAMAACGFHNSKTGFKPNWRTKTYYTFSDFFVQTKYESSPSGIKIKYKFIEQPKKGGTVDVWKERKKNVNGKWNDYNTRPIRNVIYFGVQRVVPYYERNTHKSYCNYFTKGSLNQEIRKRVQEIAGRVLGKTYIDFDLHEHSKYSLPTAKSRAANYSGFNMGAGESAVFEILTTLFLSGQNSLLVIDEIELGLHERAQCRFINELKEICKDLHCQIICSTHSRSILAALPPEGRFYIESDTNKTEVTPNISADWACGKLAGHNTKEIDIFVEDGVGEAIVLEVLPHSLRERIQIIQIGSSEAILRQLSARYRENRDRCLAFFDGDKRSEHNDFPKKIKNHLETRFRESEEEVNEWIQERLAYLPGETYPEKWLLSVTLETNEKTSLVSHLGLTSSSQLNGFLEDALRAGKHNEFYSLHTQTHRAEEQVRCDIIRFVKNIQSDAFDALAACVQKRLDAA